MVYLAILELDSVVISSLGSGNEWSREEHFSAELPRDHPHSHSKAHVRTASREWRIRNSDWTRTVYSLFSKPQICRSFMKFIPFLRTERFCAFPLLSAVARPPAPCSYPLTHCISEFPGIITKYSKLWLIFFFFKREVYLTNILESRSPALGDYTDSLWREPFNWATSG